MASADLVLCVLRRVAGWVAGGCWDDKLTSDEMDHSRKIPCVKRSSKFSVLKPPMNSMEG